MLTVTIQKIQGGYKIEATYPLLGTSDKSPRAVEGYGSTPRKAALTAKEIIEAALEKE